eukprot:TRINITY_DN4703_c0_g1_i2.p1 TRINITY_DN4703_c0_g1~~TRINITY_DN4703_c0_g1_i2.p1  ORF type:complete len:412 (-),score=58.63 TRINITY_DN4703_c0_g1_i2:86-1321(-)
MLADLFQSLLCPDEILAMIKVQYDSHRLSTSLDSSTAEHLNSKAFCYAVLNKVSRSFALVIQQLPEELKHPVCLFYLILRGLDTVEDDMKLDLATKIPLLLSFHEKVTVEGFRLDGIGDGAYYTILLQNFDKVVFEFKSIKECYQKPILEITRKMGEGMAEFCKRTVVSQEDYDLYCHYVAGLVGVGLTQLFGESPFEDSNIKNHIHLASSMGLFLQKTNIIRDYLEDLNESRVFWPETVWSKYATKIEEFRDASNKKNGLECLNEMINNALQHVPDVLEYLSKLNHPMVFSFCAIPQVMAIATLTQCYNNVNVFSRVVKIRKGLSAKLMLTSRTIPEVRYWFNTFLDEINLKANLATSQGLTQTPSRTKELISLAVLPRANQKTKTVGWSAPTVLASLAVVGLLGSFIMF